MDDRMRSMSETGRQAADEAQTTMSRATTRMQERAAELGERARHTAAEASDRLARASDRIAEASEPLGEWAEQARDYLESTSYLPESRVHSQSKLDKFGSQDIPNFHPLHYFLVREGLEASTWMILDSSKPYVPRGRTLLWTDGFASIWSVLK